MDKDGAVTIHQRNLRALAIEMYKISNGLDIPWNTTRSSCQIKLDIDGNITDVSKN